MLVEEMFYRLSMALLLGAVLGIERQGKGKPAGLRTYMLVSLGTASFTVLSFALLGPETDKMTDIDPLRVVQGITGGIGFLGAGSIIQSQGRVRGLTTAAGIWVAGAIGCICGCGELYLALITTAMAFFTMTFVRAIEVFLRNRGP